MAIFIPGDPKSLLIVRGSLDPFVKTWRMLNPTSGLTLSTQTLLLFWRIRSFFEIPIQFKPTYVNMNLINEELSLSNFIHDGNWNFSSIHLFLSEHFNPPKLDLSSIDPSTVNSWVWI